MASTSLSRTSVSTSNRKTWTFSMWFKRSGSGNSRQFVMRNITGGGTSYLDMELLSSTPDVLSLFNFNGSTVFEFKTNQVFRDFNGWYHVVYACDTTQATESDRFKMWVNGEQVTSFATATYPSQNADTDFLYADNLYLGTAGASLYFDGSMAHVHMIEGTAYDADTFGETDATTGIWKPKTAPSVTYGGEGCFLKFENSGAFGTDSSGNANNFTVNGTMTQTIDTPSNVFATFNALDFSGGALSNGNLTQTNSGACNTNGTLGMVDGKYYWEVKMVSASGGVIGIGDGTAKLGTALSDLDKIYGYSPNGQKFENTTGTSYGATYTTGDIIGVAFDGSTRELEFYKNNVSQGVAFTVDAGFTYLPQFHLNNTSVNVNFGNGYFGTTKITSPYNDSNGIGLFNYEPPTNFLSLCTKSLNEQEYD